MGVVHDEQTPIGSGTGEQIGQRYRPIAGGVKPHSGGGGGDLAKAVRTPGAVDTNDND